MSSTSLTVIGIVADALTANPAVIVSISGVGLALKTFSETKDYKCKIEISLPIQRTKKCCSISEQL